MSARWRRRPALLLALAAPLTPPQGAEDDALRIEELESPAPEGSSLSNLVGAPDGSVLLSWVEPDGERGGTLRFARGTPAGFGQPVRVAAGADWVLNWADFPALGVLPDGTLIAHWLRVLGAGSHAYGAEFALSRDGGTTWSAPRLLHADRSSAEHGFVSFAALDAGRFGALWLDGGPAAAGHGSDPAAMALCARTISAEGELGPEVTLDARVCSCCGTGLAALAPGAGQPAAGLIALYRDRSADEVRDISWVRFDGAGAGAPQSVRDDGWQLPGCPVNGPRVAAAAGQLAAAWYTGAGGGAGRVLAARFDPGSGAFGPATAVDDGAPEGRVDALFLPDGTLLVSWLEHEQGEAAWRVRRLLLADAVGLDRGREPSTVVAAADSDRRSGFLRMAASAGGAHLTWTDPGPPARVRVARLRLPDAR